jgi:hypothetical protein
MTGLSRLVLRSLATGPVPCRTTQSQNPALTGRCCFTVRLGSRGDSGFHQYLRESG